jgi:RHS repeat-associated protein
VLHDGSASYVYGNGAERLRAAGGAWYVPDALGSVRATMDGSGTVLATTSYDPWGLPQASAIAPFGFTGEVQDAAGMVYLRARWYDAGSGRFGVRDPFAGLSRSAVFAQPVSVCLCRADGVYRSERQCRSNLPYWLSASVRRRRISQLRRRS